MGIFESFLNIARRSALQYLSLRGALCSEEKNKRVFLWILIVTLWRLYYGEEAKKTLFNFLGCGETFRLKFH